jgi:hypothetical protein
MTLSLFGGFSYLKRRCIMPNKGFYTQGFAILLDNEVPLDRIVDAISDEFKVVKRIDKSSDWAISGPAITIEYQKEINGYISADVVNATWPDGMGDPQKESMIFGAWAMGHFGPFTYPVTCFVQVIIVGAILKGRSMHKSIRLLFEFAQVTYLGVLVKMLLYSRGL